MINKKKDRKVNSEEDVNTPTWISPKYEKLARYSKEAQSWKIDYALNDKICTKLSRCVGNFYKIHYV